MQITRLYKVEIGLLDSHICVIKITVLPSHERFTCPFTVPHVAQYLTSISSFTINNLPVPLDSCWRLLILLVLVSPFKDWHYAVLLLTKVFIILSVDRINCFQRLQKPRCFFLIDYLHQQFISLTICLGRLYYSHTKGAIQISNSGEMLTNFLY